MAKMRRFRVEFERTLKVSGSVIVTAKDAEVAIEKVQDLFDAGKFGVARVMASGVGKVYREADIESEEDEIEILNAYGESNGDEE